MPLNALFRLAFASPSTVSVLSLPHVLTRWLILLKARRQDFSLRPVVSVRFQILFHSPRRGSFHLSLTVLLRYRSSSVFSLGRWSAQLPTELACSVVLRIPSLCIVYLYGTLTLFGWLSHAIPVQRHSNYRVLQPPTASCQVWANPLSLATTRRIFSFPRPT